MASSSVRPILAAPPTVGEGSGSPSGRNPRQPSRGGGRAKRVLIESACAACRKRKSKCDGQRPVCSRCQTLRTECVYEAREGESRWSALRRRKKDVEGDRDDLRELVSFLQLRPEAEALDIFHRIRSSGYEDLLRLIRHAREDGHSLSGQTLDPSQGRNEQQPHRQQRLPSIQTMLSDPPDPQPGSSGGHSQAQSADSRRQRLPSLSSDGSGDSYLSSASAGASSSSRPTDG